MSFLALLWVSSPSWMEDGGNFQSFHEESLVSEKSLWGIVRKISVRNSQCQPISFRLKNICCALLVMHCKQRFVSSFSVWWDCCVIRKGLEGTTLNYESTVAIEALFTGRTSQKVNFCVVDVWAYTLLLNTCIWGGGSIFRIFELALFLMGCFVFQGTRQMLKSECVNLCANLVTYMRNIFFQK